MTRRRAPTPLPALRALASIPLAGALVACSPTRGEPPLPAGVAATAPVTASAAVPATVPGLIAAGEILIDAAQSPQAPVSVDAVRKEAATNVWAGAAMPAPRRCRTRAASPNARTESGGGGAATGCADTRP